MHKRWRLQDMTFSQWAMAYLGVVALCSTVGVLAKFWTWALLGLPVDFWQGFIRGAAAVVPAAVVGASVCAGRISGAAKTKS